MARLIDAIYGHRDIWQSLMRQKQSGRLAHGLAFTGPTGVGKRQVAIALAQALACESDSDLGGEACGICGPCRRVALGQSTLISETKINNNRPC